MLRTAVLPASMLALMMTTGCSGGETDSGSGECENPYTAYPADSATGVYYRTTVEADFLVADESATITVEGVDGTSAWRGNTLVFTPTSPLSPSSSYTATVSYGCGTESWTFQTGEVGAEVTAAESTLLGKTYNLDLSNGRYIHPENVGSLLSTQLKVDILVNVASVTAEDIVMVGAIGAVDSEGNPVEPPAQDPCTSTIDFPEAVFTANPYFQVGPDDTTINVQGYEIPIEGLLVSGAFAPDGSYIAGATLAGKVDTRPLVDAFFGPDDPDDAICEVALTLGITCEECGGDAPGPYCLSIEVDSMSAVEVDAPVTAMTQEEACAKEECANDSSCIDTDPPDSP